MIISHKYKFIFVRTRKVASSSLEIALSQFLEPTDFATRQSDREKSNNRLMPNTDSRVFAGFDKKLRPILPYGHAPIKMAYRIFGSRVLNYTVFSVDRNPWDRAVSTFYWSNRSTNMRSASFDEQKKYFRDYILDVANPNWQRRWFGVNAHRDISQRWLYSIGETACFDYLLRYEALQEDLNSLSAILNLPSAISVKGIDAKTKHRNASSRQFQGLYDEETREIVADKASWEVATLGYDVHGTLPPPFSSDNARHEVKADYIKKIFR